MATETKRVYDIQVNGVDSFNELKNTIEQLNDKLKTLNETSKEYKDTLAELTEYQSKLSDAMKGISDSAEKTDGSLSGIKETIDSVSESISALGEDVINSFSEGLAQGMAEAAAETIQLGDNMDKGVNSVKDLKQEISDLRDRLVTLDKGTDEYKSTVQELINDQVKLKEVMNAGKNETQAAEGSYNALTQRMSALKQVWKETTDEATRNEIGQQINEINNQLKALDASIGNSQRNVGNYKSALEGLDDGFVNLKTQLRECKEAMQQLDPASEAYNEAMMRAAEITHQLSEQQEQIKYASTDVGDQLENVRGIATNMAAGFSAVNAAMGLFGEENEEVQQAMLKVQQAMALVQGLQGLDGFIKRTKGLSQSMGLVTKATQANTVATKANATAAKADATAKAAETVATKAAVPAQLSLNAAMKANPIGFIVGLIATLVTAMMLLKDKIMEMIGSNKEMSAAFDKVKAVLAGFGNVIKKSIINPIKMAIIPIKTLAKVMIDLFKGDWTAIGDDIKAGFEEMKDNVVDTINVVGAFKEGYDKKVAEQNEAARKAEAAAREKELDNIIKDNEAKYGSDWKYTDEAKKLYEEMFKVRMAQYKEDSDEYREAQRDKMAYDRDFSKHQEEEQKERNQKAKKATEDAEKARKKIVDDNLKSIEKAYTDFYGKFGSYISKEDKNLMGVIDGWDNWISKLVISFKSGSTVVERNVSDMKKYLMDSLNISKKDADTFVKQLVDLYYKGNQEIKVLIGNKSAVFSISDQFIKGLQEQYGFTLEEAQRIVKEIRENFNKAEYEKMVNASLANIEKDFYNFDRIVKQTMASVKSEFDLKEAVSGITIPDEAIANVENLFTMASQNVRNEIVKTEDEIDRLYKIMAGDEKKSPYFGLTMEELGQILPSFQKLLDKKNELDAEENKLELERFQKVSEIRLKAYDIEEAAITKRYEKELSDMQFTYDQEELLIQKRNEWYSGYNVIEGLKRQRDFQNSYYDELINMYQEEMRMYAAMAENEELTFEERMKARETFTKLQFETEKALQDKQKDDLKTSKQLIKEWVTAVKDATQSIANILGTIADSWSSLIDLESNAIQTELEEGKISEDEAARREEQNKKSFEDLKKFQIAQAIINTLAAAVSAYQSMASIPYVGPVLGAAAAAAALAAGYAQVKQIQATSYGNGSSSSAGGGGGSSSTNFQLPSVMELEPNMGRNITNMNDTDELNNSGGRGRGETAIRAFVVESEISASQELANKRHQEVTF